MHNFFEAKNSWFWERGSEPPPHQLLEEMGSAVSSPSVVRGGRKRILVYFELENHISQQLFWLFIWAETVEMVHFDAGMQQSVCLTTKNTRLWNELE